MLNQITKKIILLIILMFSYSCETKSQTINIPNNFENTLEENKEQPIDK